MTVLILNGPNLNMLGMREPEVYGAQTLEEVQGMCREKAMSLGFGLDFRQSNHEGVLIDWIQAASQNSDIQAVIINAAAYTHTSIAIHDALRLLRVPIIEVHISDPKKRESFRHHSYVESLAAKVITGQGTAGYEMALDECARLLDAA